MKFKIGKFPTSIIFISALIVTVTPASFGVLSKDTHDLMGIILICTALIIEEIRELKVKCR